MSDQQEAEPVARPQGFFTLSGDARLRECATDICSQSAGVRVEFGGIGSDYCEPCARKIAEMNAPAPAVPVEGIAQIIRDNLSVPNFNGPEMHDAHQKDILATARLIGASLRSYPAPQDADQLRAENDRLREALAYIMSRYEEGTIAYWKAKEALK